MFKELEDWFFYLPIAIGVLLTVLLTVGRPYSSIEVCNMSPYETSHIVFQKGGDRLFYLAGVGLDVEPGDCNFFHAFTLERDPEFFVATDVSRSGYSYIRNIQNSKIFFPRENSGRTSNPLSASDIQYFGSTFICSSKSEIEEAGYEINPSCPREHALLAMQPAFAKKKWRWRYIWEHPNYPLMENTGKLKKDMAEGLEKARQLAEVIDVQKNATRKWSRIFPFVPGGAMEDINGPLNPGVWVFDLPRVDSFGEPQRLREGDIIEAVNGVTVYGEQDLIYQIDRHATSRQKGIQVPVVFDVRRGSMSTPLTIEAPYFFNTQYKDHSSDQSGIAFWYGVGDGITFNQTPWVVCNGANLAISALRGGSKVVEALRSALNDERYDRRNELDIDYIDADECKWQQEQMRGLARQVENDIYANSQYVAIFTPSAVRLAGHKALSKHIARQGVARATSARLSSSGLEAVESALWSLSTSPPGVSADRRMREMAYVAGLGAASGYVFGGSLEKAKKLANQRR